jgi:hypothetical protein
MYSTAFAVRACRCTQVTLPPPAQRHLATYQRDHSLHNLQGLVHASQHITAKLGQRAVWAI